MRFGLPEDIITKLNEVFEVNAKVDKALIFGSRAKGNYRSDSDIDIAIKGADITLDDILKMQVEFEEKGIKYKIDLVDYHTVKEEALIEHVDRVGIEMYRRLKVYKLGELAKKITSGGTPSTKNAEYYDGNIPWLNTKEINFNRIWRTEKYISEKGLKNSSAKWIEENSIIVAMYGATAAKVAINKIPLTTNQACCNLTIDQKKADYEFVFYYIWSKYEELENIAVGAAQQNLSVGVIADFPIQLPPLSEQTAIAEVLSSLDDKIDLLHRQNKTLEQLAETLFRQWFVGNQKIELRNGKLGELIETTLGGEWGKEIAEGDYTKQVCCIRGTDIADLQTGLAERTPIRFVKERKFESIEPKDGDLILEISGGTDDQSTGRTIYITELNKTLFPYPLVFSNFCRLLRPRRKEYCYFLFLYIQYLYKQDEFFNLENGSSGIKNLDYKYLLFELEYPLPEDKGHILNFNKEIEIYFEKINKNKHQILTLKQLRDALLPKLMSGEIRIDLEDSELTKPVKSKKANVG